MNARGGTQMKLAVIVVLGLGLGVVAGILVQGGSLSLGGGDTDGATSTTGDLVAYYPFDEGSGLWAFDYSGNGNRLRVTASWVDGKFGSALSLSNGTGAVSDNLNADELRTVAVSFWLRTDESGNSGNASDAYQKSVFRKLPATPEADVFPINIYGTGTNPPLTFERKTPGPASEENNHRIVLRNTGQWTSDEWHHVVVQFYNEEVFEIWVDGRLNNQAQIPIDDLGSLAIDGRFVVGNQELDADIDDLRIYSMRLTRSNIQTLMSGDSITDEASTPSS